MVSKGLDGIIFDISLFIPFEVTTGFVRSKVSVHPLIFDAVIMHALGKGDLFEFIGRR